jgi:hypothetical protein
MVSAKEKIMFILVSEIKLMGLMDLLRNQCIEILSCIYFFTEENVSLLILGFIFINFNV